MNNKRILVTGASGFIGSHTLKHLLNQNLEVHAVSHKRLLKLSKVNWHCCDLLDKSQRRTLLRQLKPEYLIHAAWYAEHGKFWYDPENNDWLNASKDLIREFADQGGIASLGLAAVPSMTGDAKIHNSGTKMIVVSLLRYMGKQNTRLINIYKALLSLD